MGIPNTISRSVLVLAAALLSAPATVQAQDGYFFRAPIATFNLRAGVGGPVARDDLFEFFTDELTLERRDFTGVAVGADLAVRAASRIDVVFSLAHDASSSDSEFADWVDQDDQPIEQTTTLSRTPLTLGAKLYMTQRGRTLSKYAWVPATFTPYVLVGGGVMFYSLEQEGDFVDFETLSVFSRQFRSSHAGATWHAGAGGEWWVTRSLGLTLEGKYAWSKADLESDFADFGHIDLSGFQFTTGIALRY